ncbi:GNAT family N-acetyltransferase [Colwelliaceae bacterium 6471]
MEKQLSIKGDIFLLSDDKSLLKLNAIHDYLTSSYWSTGISKTLIERAIDNSLCFGLYANEQQIGFARVITDKSSFAYLADVFVLPDYEKRGLGTALIDFIMQHTDLKNLRRFMLCTRDAHGLYRKFGFTEIDNPKMMMQINQPDLYLNGQNSSALL